MTWMLMVIGAVVVSVLLWFISHQQKLRLRAHLMEEAIRNKDFTFRMPTHGMFSGERAMQETLNQLGETIRRQVNQHEVESWERLTRVLTHEIMNATAPITSISQYLLSRQDVKGTDLEDGIQAISDTSRHLNEFVANYRKISELEKPVMTEVNLCAMVDDIKRTDPQLLWETNIPSRLSVQADAGMLRQVMMNIVKNAMEAGAKRMVIEPTDKLSESQDQYCLYFGNDGIPIPAEDRRSIFIPFFTTKRKGNGIGLSLSRRMMIQQGGMLELADQPLKGCLVGFFLSLSKQKSQ